jgi:hypothetical protein
MRVPVWIQAVSTHCCTREHALLEVSTEPDIVSYKQTLFLSLRSSGSLQYTGNLLNFPFGFSLLDAPSCSCCSGSFPVVVLPQSISRSCLSPAPSWCLSCNLLRGPSHNFVMLSICRSLCSSAKLALGTQQMQSLYRRRSPIRARNVQPCKPPREAM